MKFNDWLNGIEIYSTKFERLYEDLSAYQGDNIEIVIKWLEAAYNEGYNHAMKIFLDDGK